MPLDPARYKFARLKDAAHRMPWNGRWFGDAEEHKGFERVDLWDAHVNMLLEGGSIELANPAPALPLVPPAGEGGGDGAPA